MEPLVDIRVFTDPACPFAYSAEPARWRLLWLFGDQLAISPVMVVLSEDPSELAAKGLTPAMLARGAEQLARRYGMPVVTGEPSRLSSSVAACRAVVATRLHQPESEEPLLRRLRLETMGGALLDEPATLERAARDAGIDFEALSEWVTKPEVDAALRHDMAESRSPSASALALNHKLAPAGDGRRYTCPSYEFTAVDSGRQAVAPGFQPVDVYEVLLADLAPQLERRAAPESVDEVLAWAGVPLATAEVAAVMGIELDEAREQLRAAAEPIEMGTDALWALAAVAVQA